MIEKNLATSWMWPVDDGINALRLDLDRALLRWYDAIGCACDDSTVDQPISDYLTDGVPSQMAPPPDDVSAELQQTIAALTKRNDSASNDSI